MNIDVLKKVLVSAIQEEIRDRNLKALNDQKIVITLTKGPKVLAKAIKVSVPRIRTVVTKQEAKKIEVIKHVVKVNTDVTYVLTLLDELKTATQNLDYKHLSDEAVSAIKRAVDALNQTPMLIGHKRSKE